MPSFPQKEKTQGLNEKFFRFFEKIFSSSENRIKKAPIRSNRVGAKIFENIFSFKIKIFPFAYMKGLFLFQIPFTESR